MRSLLSSLLLLPLFSACVDDAADVEETSEIDSDLSFGSTTLTLYENANFTGATYTTTLAGSGDNETIKLLSKPDVQAAGLLGRVSAVQLRCGTRDAQVSLFDAYNPSNTSFANWSYLGGHGAFIHCSAGQSVAVNLHTQFPAVADRVASAILVTHAREVGNVGFGDLFETAWQGSLESLPSSVNADRTDIWLTSMRTFKVRQYLTLDQLPCPALGAIFELQVRLLDDHTFSASTTDLYVDYSEWDLNDVCHNYMKSKLEDSLPKARAKLTDKLDEFISIVAPGHARYYFTPFSTLRQFALFFGGDPLLNAPL